MSKPEKTFERDNAYSLWHRTLGNCPAVDIDWVEYRDGKIVAFIDVTGRMVDSNHIINSTPYIWARTTVQRDILTQLSHFLDVPSYFVLHTTDLTLFHVYHLPDIKDYIAMNKQEYANFIKSL